MQRQELLTKPLKILQNFSNFRHNFLPLTVAVNSRASASKQPNTIKPQKTCLETFPYNHFFATGNIQYANQLLVTTKYHARCIISIHYTKIKIIDKDLVGIIR